MIDASRSPKPLWIRVAAAVVVIAALVAVAWLIWVKELHHQSIHLRVFASAVAAVAMRIATTGPSPSR